MEISPCFFFFAKARRVNVSKFRAENKAILRLRPRKLIFLLLSKMKGFLREQFASDYVQCICQKSYLSIYLDARYFLTVPLLRL